MEFYERLKNLRKQANLTQADFANKLGVHFQTISKWERGATLPDVGMLGLIAKELGVTLELLLDIKTDKPIVSGVFDQKALANVIAYYRKNFGLSQADLAGKLGVSADSVSKWERAIICPDVDSLVNMSKEFGISVSMLYYGKKQEQRVVATKTNKNKTFRLISIGILLAVILFIGVFSTYLLIPKTKTYTVYVYGNSTYQVNGGNVFTPTEPKKQGYKFIGYTDEVGKPIEFPRKISQNITIYPQFEVIEYNVNFWLNGGVFDNQVKSVYTIEDVGSILPIPVKGVQVFGGWYLTNDFSGEPITQIEFFERDITLYAKWEIQVYTIEYHLNGGTVQGNPTTVDNGLQTKLKQPTKNGYQFLGWFDSEQGGTEYTHVGGEYAKNLVLYARWIEIEQEETPTTGSVSNFQYEKSNDNVTITKYKGKFGENVDVIIPDYIEGLPVTTLGESCIASHNQELRSIKLPNTLTSISDYAIDVKYVSEPIIIPKSVNDLGRNCISGRVGSLQFEQESSLKILYEYAFECLKIEDVFVVPKGVVELKVNSLPSDSMGIILPNSLINIDRAFDHIDITYGGKIFIPSSVKQINSYFWRWTIYTDKPNNSAIKEAQEECVIRGIGKSTITLVDGNEVVDTLEGYAFNLPNLEKPGYTFLGWKDENDKYVSKYFVNEYGLSAILRADFKENTENDGRDKDNAILLNGDVLKNTIYMPVTDKLYLTLDYDVEKYYLSISFEKSLLACVYNNAGKTNSIRLQQTQEILIYYYIDKDFELEFSSFLSCTSAVKVNITLIPIK